MDIVYLCRTGPNEELRFSLRSLVNLPHDQVWIFGGAPDWVRNLRHFRTPAWGTKHETTNHSLRDVCLHPEVSDPFVLMNDDFYVMRPGKGVPTQHRGTIRQVIAEYEAQGIESDYVAGMRRTLRMLESRGHEDPLSFELHTPMMIRKEIMLQALALGPYQRRSVYAALAGITGRHSVDVKVARVGATIPTGRFLSTMDSTFEYVRPTLERAFPKPGRHEA